VAVQCAGIDLRKVYGQLLETLLEHSECVLERPVDHEAERPGEVMMMMMMMMMGILVSLTTAASCNYFFIYFS
jgi:hypothetical protein